MLKLKLYRISADNGKTYTNQYLTQQEADEQKANSRYIIEPAPAMWDTANIMDQILRRAERIEKTQNPSTARDFLEEIQSEISRLIPPAAIPEEPKKLCVCERCLMGIESHEGRQATFKIYVDDDPRPCDWCEEDGFDVLYEIQ